MDIGLGRYLIQNGQHARRWLHRDNTLAAQGQGKGQPPRTSANVKEGVVGCDELADSLKGRLHGPPGIVAKVLGQGGPVVLGRLSGRHGALRLGLLSLDHGPPSLSR